MKTSAIGWTDFSGGDLNFVTGCTPISEGCKNCYARRIYERFGRDFSQVTFHADKLARLQRKRFPKYSPKRGEGHKPMAFVVDTGDLFHPDVPDEQIEAAFRVMIERDDVVWQVLTKRAKRMQSLLSFWHGIGTYPLYYPSNIWLGVTVENQRCADERIPLLIDTPAAVKFISVEPMLEAIDLTWHLVRLHEYVHTSYVTRDMAIDCGDIELEGEPFTEQIEEDYEFGLIDWIICGGESGPDRRPFDVQWAVDLYEQCRGAGVYFFGKQDSDLYPGKPLILPGYGVVHEWPEEDTYE